MSGLVLTNTSSYLPTPTSIVNYFSNNGYIGQDLSASPHGAGVNTFLSGALTANTLSSMLNLTGSGVLNFLGASCIDGTPRTLRMKLTLDGRVVFDSTSTTMNSPSVGGFIIGSGYNAASSSNLLVSEFITFKQSCLFEIASNLTETDKFTVLAKYFLTS